MVRPADANSAGGAASKPFRRLMNVSARLP
jgi:hypothetical protein